MKKYLSMICCLGALLTAGCSNDKTGEEEGPTGEAKITAFGFKAENNPDYLVKDYTGTISGTAISVKVPADTDLSALVATFETADGESTVTVNGTTQVSGTTANDFSDPVDYLVSLGKKNALYTVTVSELPEAVWTKVTEWEQTVNDFRLEIDPTDGQPALVVNADGTTSAEDVAIFAKVSNGKFQPDTVAARRTSMPAFGFSASGKPYIFYYDPVSSVAKGFIATRTGTSWTEECTDIDRPTTVGPTIGSVGERMFAFTMNRTAGVLGERFVNITEYNNGWNKNQSIAGRTSGRAYSVIARNVGNAMYVLVHNPAETASNTPHSVSIYKFENNMWSTIIEAYVKPNEAGDSYVPIDLTNHDLAVDKDGNIYLGISYNLTPQVVKFDSSSKDFNLVATVFPKWHSRANYCRVAVSPISILYVAYKDADNHLFTTSLDNKTKDWKTAVQLSTEAVDGFEFKFAENGTAYLAYNVDAEKVEGEIVSPAKIHLYKLATAE